MKTKILYLGFVILYLVTFNFKELSLIKIFNLISIVAIVVFMIRLQILTKNK